MKATTFLFAAALSAGIAVGAFAQTGIQSPPGATPSQVPNPNPVVPTPNAGSAPTGQGVGVGPRVPDQGSIGKGVGPQALDDACAADIQRFCNGKSGEELRSCLYEKRPSVSAACGATLTIAPRY
jgi:hypothetical protein